MRIVPTVICWMISQSCLNHNHSSTRSESAVPISTSQLQHACIFSLLCLSLALSHLSPNHSYSLKTSSFPPFFHYKLVPTTLFCACALPQIGSLVIVKMKFRHLLMPFFALIPYVSSFGIQNYPTSSLRQNLSSTTLGFSPKALLGLERCVSIGQMN